MLKTLLGYLVSQGMTVLRCGNIRGLCVPDASKQGLFLYLRKSQRKKSKLLRAVPKLTAFKESVGPERISYDHLETVGKYLSRGAGEPEYYHLAGHRDFGDYRRRKLIIKEVSCLSSNSTTD